MNSDKLNERRASLSNQGQVWKNLIERKSIGFERPAPLFDQPMEISIKQIRGLRMVDETVVVHGKFKENLKAKEDLQ